MINFSFGVSNPFSRRWETLFCKHWRYSQYKAAEVQLVADNTIIGLTFRWTVMSDHAGISCDISLLGYTLFMQQYDVRHWE
jgi:hypothetical protein